MSPDDLTEGFRLFHRQVVLRTAPRAGQVDVLDLVGAVVLGPSLEVSVPDHPDLLEHGQGPVHGRGVHRGEAPVDPAGHVLRGDVPVGAKHLLQDHLTLRGDPVASLSEHPRDHRGLVHDPQGSAGALQLQSWGRGRKGRCELLRVARRTSLAYDAAGR
jgi:hypothetical protein